MDDDWQATAFNNKRIPHGRSKKGGKASGRKGAASFDPQNAMGSYELSGKAIDTFGGKLILEIHELSETPGGLVASMVLDGRFKAAVLIAGSKGQLKRVIEEAEEAAEDEGDDEASGSEGEHSQDEDEDDTDSDSEPDIQRQDRLHNERIEAFAKNSFRNPKFFLQWQGEVTLAPGQVKWERSRGYVVFSGNDCKDFEGTLSCRTIGWKDVAVKGRKITSKARAPPFGWVDLSGEEDEYEDEDEDDE